MKIDLTTLSVLEPAYFVKEIEIENNNLLDSTLPGEWMKQTVPSIYFRSNEHYQIEQDTAIPGLLLTITSSEKFIIFCFEFYESPFIQFFDKAKHKFAPFLKIKRTDLIDFQKNEEVKFIAVKPKKSYEMMSNMRGAPVGGLIIGGLFKGAFKLAGKMEDSTVEKNGFRYSLNFKDDNITKSVDIVSETFYIADLEKFLTRHWTKETPTIPVIPKEEKSKGGCFIATACYGDYDDPNVIVLRQFRDNVLTKSKTGRAFISFYYKYSPSIARKIEKKKTLKSLIRLFLIQPLIKLTSKTKK